VLWQADATKPFSGQRGLATISFDVIVDDGSHRLGDQLAALLLWWPSLRRGGKYFIEDIHPDNLDSLLAYVQGCSIDYHLYDGRGPGMPFDELMLTLTK
jgi:hypothetical protein